MIEKIVRQLFSENTVIHVKTSCFSVPEDRFLIISGNHGPRWIVPENPLYGLQVLQQWQPYGNLSRLKWKVLLLAYKLGVLGWVKGIRRIEIIDACSQNWSDYGLDNKTTALPVIYVGTPGSTRKAVAVIVFEKLMEGLVVKIPLEKKAGLNILNEASILLKLQEIKPDMAPKLLFINEDNGVTSQTIMYGRPSGRKFTSLHLDWLLRLLTKGVTTLTIHVDMLVKNINLVDSVSFIEKQFILDIANQLRDAHSLPLVCVHGDFVPWNIKFSGNELIVIDWEDGNELGLPLQDLVHFFVMQDYLFNSEIKFIKSFFKNKYVNIYMRKSGVDQDMLHKLLMYYLIDFWCKRINIGDTVFSGYLLKVIRVLQEG